MTAGVLKRGHGGRNGASDQGAPPLRSDGNGAAAPSTPGCSTTRARTRRFLVLAVAIGGLTALLLIAQAWLIAHVVAGAFLDHRTLESLRGALLALLAVVAGRSLLAWAAERTAHRASASAKSELRRRRRRARRRAGPGRARAERTRTPQHASDNGHRRARRLLRPLPAPAVLGRDRAGRHHRRRGRGGLGQRRADCRQPAADPDLHGPGRAPPRGTAPRPACVPSRSWPATSSMWWPGCPRSRSSGGPRPRPGRSPTSPTVTARPPSPPCG